MDSILIFIVQRDGEVLLVKRKQRGGTTSPWVFPADSLRGEDIVQESNESMKALLGVDPAETTIIEERSQEESQVSAYYVSLHVEDEVNPVSEITDTKWVRSDSLQDKVDAEIDDAVLSHIS